MPERVFVTGATGAVGSHVVPELVRLGYDVTAVGRSDAKRATLQKMGARAVASPADAHGRISTELAAKALAGHDVVINLATHMPPTTTRMLLPWEWRENDRIRRDDSAAFVDAAVAAGVTRFIQESFAPIYEDGGDRWIDESFPCGRCATTEPFSTPSVRPRDSPARDESASSCASPRSTDPTPSCAT
jgi:nucleoside-diphosphate-sugar epimerase